MKPMPKWGYLMVLLFPFIVVYFILMLCVLPIIMFVALITMFVCDIFGWKLPEWAENFSPDSYC